MTDFLDCYCAACRAMARRKQGQQIALLDAIHPAKRKRPVKSPPDQPQTPAP